MEQALKNQDAQKLLKDPEMKELLREALKNPKLSNQQLEDLHKQLDQIKPEDRKKLADQVEKRPNDFNLDDKTAEEFRKIAEKKIADLKPEDRAKWTEFAKKIQENPNLPSDPGTSDTLKRILPEITPPPTVPTTPPDTTRVKPPVETDPLPSPTVEPHPTPMSNPPISSDLPKPELKPESPPPPSQNLNDLTTTGLMKLADWLHERDPNDEHLDYLAEFVSTLLDGKGDDHGAAETIGKTVDWLGSLHIGEWNVSNQTAETGGSWFDKLNGSSLPKMDRMPSGPSLSSSPSSSPSIPSSSGSLGLESLATIFVWTVSLALVGFVALRLLLWYRAGAAGRGGLSRHWPVRPGDVSTRGDLVRAFEYLALKLLGIDAQHRHHLDLARRLGGSAQQADDARRLAANHLAHLYELARYAPEDEPLPETELAAARRDLSFLAGAAAA